MLLASRLTETHARAVQGLSAEPADTGGRVAARPPAPGPPLDPEVHDAASATTPNATTQIRLTTADLPAPATASQRCSPNWDDGSSCRFRVPGGENTSQVRLFHGLAKIHAPSTLGSFLRSFTRGERVAG